MKGWGSRCSIHTHTETPCPFPHYKKILFMDNVGMLSPGWAIPYKKEVKK